MFNLLKNLIRDNQPMNEDINSNHRILETDIKKTPNS